LSSSSQQFEKTSHRLSKGATQSANAIEETSSMLREMSSSTHDNMGTVSKASDLMGANQTMVDQTHQSIIELKNSMQEVVSASEETKNIISTIENIAFQTNLLALNASVEAARAGEAGKGFAVVAQEVKSLANKASDEAQETAEILEGTAQKVQSAFQTLDTTEQSFDQMAETSASVDELMQQITHGAKEQQQKIEKITQSIANIKAVTQQTSAAADQTTCGARTIVNLAENLLTIARDLESLVHWQAVASRRKDTRTMRELTKLTEQTHRT
jgi:methyl-accepting chemotaxis protein